MKNIETLTEYCSSVTSPILYSYVDWIICSAEKQKVRKLYFLARDGYILKKIAEIICESKGYKIELRYLFCSRLSLKGATFDIISPQEFRDTINTGGENVNLDVLLKRFNIAIEESLPILQKLRIENSTKSLSNLEQTQIFEELYNSDEFLTKVFRKSKTQRENLFKYLEQEKVTLSDFIIVDSGWSGSIQRSFRQVLRHYNFEHEIHGYYFGMYTYPKNIIDGRFYTFYFNHSGPMRRKLFFNNNLFECMLSAPHGTTIGYTMDKNDNVIPIIKENRSESELSFVIEHIDSIYNSLKQFKNPKCFVFLEKHIKRYMVFPTSSEIELLSNFHFCTDVAEVHLSPLSEKGAVSDLASHLIVNRAIRKISKGRIGKKKRTYVWNYSAIMGLPSYLRVFYRWNEYVWEIFRLLSLSKKTNKED